MAYTSGVFRIDLVSGSDAARTALTSCTASNPSGTVTRINKTGHGLVTGAVVDLTLFSSWLNDAFKITVVDADNFDLDDTVWQTTADNSGTVTPRGGSSWSDAWLTVNGGPTAARIQPGDEIRFAKTADPVSLGQSATWTDQSQTVTLTTAVTKKAHDASGTTGWTAATNITLSASTSRKLGSNSLVITPAAGFTTGKMCYATIDGGGTQDFSGYRYINLWFMPVSAVAFNASDLSICLCSDATGDTPVNTLNFPAILASNNWNCLVLDNSSALSSSVQSVAIYANVDPGTTAIRINNIFASNGDLSLKTLIGPSNTDVNYNIQSIDGTTIKIDSNNTSASGRGYSGSTGSSTLYYRVPFDVTTTGMWATPTENGSTSAAKNHYAGGYNTSNDTRDGVTCLASTIVGTGTVFSTSSGSFSKFSYFTFARFSLCLSGTGTNQEYSNIVFCGGALFANTGNGTYYLFSNFKLLNNSGSAVFGVGVNFENCTFNSNTLYAVSVYPQTEFLTCTFANNGSGSIQLADGEYIKLRNCTLSDSTEVAHATNRFGRVWSFDHDNTAGNHWGFGKGATINWQTAVQNGSDPGAWKIAITSSTRTSYKPVQLKVHEPYCKAGSAVTITCEVKKDHATNVAAKLYVLDAFYNIDGVSATSDTKADDTSWEVLTISFTPTEDGVVPIYVDAWYVSGASNVYVGRTEATQ